MSVLLCSAGYDHNVLFWSATTGTCVGQAPFEESQVNRLSISSDRRFVAAAGNPLIKMYDPATRQVVRQFDGHTGNVTAVGFQRDSKWLYSASEDGTIKVWDVRVAHKPQRDYIVGAAVSCAALHPNQAEIVSGDHDGQVKMWDLSVNSLAHSTDTATKCPIQDVSVAADASIVVAGNNRGVCFVWDATQSSELLPVARFDAHDTYCLRSVVSPDARYVATASADRSIKVWDAQDGFKLHRTLSGHQKWVWDCAFSADSAYIVSASSDRTGRLWELSSGEPVVEYKGHTKACTSIALNDSAAVV